MDKKFLEVLACPRCEAKIVLEDEKIICRSCKQEFQIRGSIPIMLVNENFKNNPLMDLIKREQRFFEDESERWLDETRTHRYRYITSFVKEILLSYKLKNKRILELGCGVSPYLELLLKENEVFAGDLSYYLLKQNPKGVFLVQLNVVNLPFCPRSFNFVYMIGALHHLPASTHKKILGEINKILRKEGRFLLVEPNICSLSGFYYLIRKGLIKFGGRRFITKLVGFVTTDEKFLNIFKTRKLLGDRWQIEKFYTIQYLRLPPIRFIKKINIEPINWLLDRLSIYLNLALFGTTCVFVLKKK